MEGSQRIVKALALAAVALVIPSSALAHPSTGHGRARRAARHSRHAQCRRHHPCATPAACAKHHKRGCFTGHSGSRPSLHAAHRSSHAATIAQRPTPPPPPPPVVKPRGPAPAPALSITGTTYYVSSTGSDSNPGTSPTAAWRTVKRVNEASLKPGDGVLFEGGATFADTYLTGNAGGESGRPISYASYGNGKANIKYGLWDASHNYLTFDDLEVNDGNLSESDGFGGRGSDITIENSTMLNVESGIFVVSGDRWDVLDNVIENTGNSGMLTQTDAEGGSTPPGEEWVIDGNVINRTGLVNLGYGEHGIYLKCRNSEVAENTITNWEHGDGISQRYGGDTIANNTLSTGGTGIAFFPYEYERLTSYWTGNVITETNTGMYAPLTDSGSPAPGGTTLENFVIEGNSIGPLIGGNEFINVQTEGTVTSNANTLV